MITPVPCVQIFKDVAEKISSVSLRRDLSTGTYIAVMRFQHLASLAHFLCSKKRSNNVLRLIDIEGEILLKPSINMIYCGPEEKYLRSVECKFETDQDELWERFMRFIHRYTEANGLLHREAEIDNRSDSKSVLYLEYRPPENYRELKTLPTLFH